MANLYEIIGRQKADLDTMHAEYDNLLGVLGRVASGEIDPKLIEVDLKGRSWKQLAPAKPEKT